MDIKERTKERILDLIKKEKRTLSEKDLYRKCKGKSNPIKPAEFKAVLSALVTQGLIIPMENGYKAAPEGVFSAAVTRLNKTFGFVHDLSLPADDRTEIFVPGKYMMGALPGDTVLCRLIPSRGELPEAEIIAVTVQNDAVFTGRLVRDNGIFVLPDELCKDMIAVEGDTDAKDGDKVAARIVYRGARHSEHRCEITASFGSADSARNCAESVLYRKEIEVDFPNAVMDEARRIGNMKITDRDIYSRLDLRDEDIFTIDGADTKDIDDAVSLSYEDEVYSLGVHIADVSYYVKPGTALDSDAFVRGTSIYYADKVVPMLPKELSNGICSLNPGEDRLAFSCLMKISSEGELISYKFSKSVIRSRVKGVYDEVNRIIEGGMDEELKERYGGLYGQIMLMKELAGILHKRRQDRGAPELETSEPKIETDENGRCIRVKRRHSSYAENMIEEFMLMANTAAARLAREKGIPFVYRIHERPAIEKINHLKEICEKLDISYPQFDSAKPVHLSMILENSHEKGMDVIMNNAVLRSMAKARYSHEPVGHFGLALDDYAHFTSPIRRYPDLAIHRILTDLCYEKKTPEELVRRYTAFAYDAAVRSSENELAAMQTERECDGIYMAEYMRDHLGEEFDGVVCNAAVFGLYVELESTIEGLVRAETLSGLEYDGDFSYTKGGKPVYTVGDSVRVKCVRAQVDTGNIDFEITGKVDRDA